MDTSAEAARVQSESFRKMTPGERFTRMSTWSSRIKRMAIDAIRRRHPEFSDQQLQWAFIEIAYGVDLAQSVRASVEGRSLESKRRG